MKFEDFVKKNPVEKAPEGVEWDAVVCCQTCNEDVENQTLYPAELLLIWTCSLGHKSYIENYHGF